MVNTSFMMGGALGLAILASLAASHTSTLRAGGMGRLAATTDGYHAAFLAAVAFALAAGALGVGLLRAQVPQTAHAHEHADDRPPVPALDYE